MKIDLNCDMGEGFGRWTMGHDAELLEQVTSANIACGFHAGDAQTMLRTVRLALQKGVALGAHPSLPDLQGFGRREMKLAPAEIYAMTLYQIGALSACAKVCGGKLHHVKAHGALYNMAARDRALADAIAHAVRDFDSTLILYALAGSEMMAAAAASGLKAASEVFADRRYQSDGCLVPRNDPRALIVDEDEAVRQVLQMVGEQNVRAIDGSLVKVDVATVCVHGDGARAVGFARRLRAALVDENIALGAMA